MNIFEKIKAHAKQIKNSLLLGGATVLSLGAAFADEVTNEVPTAAQLTTNVINPVTSSMSVTYILSIVAAVLAAGIIYMVLWWALRYVFKRIKGFAFRGKGRI